MASVSLPLPPVPQILSHEVKVFKEFLEAATWDPQAGLPPQVHVEDEHGPCDMGDLPPAILCLSGGVGLDLPMITPKPSRKRSKPTKKRKGKSEYVPPPKRFKKTATGTGIPENGKLLDIIRSKFDGAATHEDMRDYLGTRKDKTALYERLNSLTKRGFLKGSTTKKKNARKYVKLYTITGKIYTDPVSKSASQKPGRSRARGGSKGKSTKTALRAPAKHSPSCVVKEPPSCKSPRGRTHLKPHVLAWPLPSLTIKTTQATVEPLTYEPHRLVLRAVQAIGGRATHQSVKAYLGIPNTAEHRKKTTWHRRLGVLEKRGYLRMAGKSHEKGNRKQNIYEITEQGTNELKRSNASLNESNPSAKKTPAAGEEDQAMKRRVKLPPMWLSDDEASSGSCSSDGVMNCESPGP